MDEITFGKRLAELRIRKSISARDMSLSLGQSAGYVNNIENGKNYPSMTVFFYICEFLGITPCDFFEAENNAPIEIAALMHDLKKLTPDQIRNIAAVVHDIAATRKP